MSGSDQRLIPGDRKAILKKSFIDLSSTSSKLTFDEILNFLSKRSGSSFSSDLLQEIFRCSNREASEKITFEEFISGFMQTEELVQHKLSSLKADISTNTTNLNDAKRQHIEAKSRKSENLLTVKIISSTVLKPANLVSGLKAPLVSLTCEGQEVNTKVAYPGKLEWNESFTFKITKGDGDLLVQVYDTDRGKKAGLIGNLKIPLVALKDQQTHNDIFELHSDKDHDRTTGDLRLELLWVYDLMMYLEGIIRDYNEAISEDMEELRQMEILEKTFDQAVNPMANIKGQVVLNDKSFGDSSKKMIVRNEKSRIELKGPAEMLILIYLALTVVITSYRADFFNVNLT